MAKLFLGLGSGLFLIKKIGGISYLLIVKDLAWVLGWSVLILILLGVIGGIIGGWLMARGKNISLLKIKKKDRVLFIAPHPDDAVLAAGGLLNHLFKEKIPLQITYLTCGDGNVSLFWRDKQIKFSPQKFIATGKERGQDAIKAIKTLGGKEKNLIFLGYPDSGLQAMQLRPKEVISSPTTKLTHCPYSFTFKKNSEYQEKNVVADLILILKRFRPTIIFLPHLKDSNADHRATTHFLQKAVAKINWSGKTYQYLIHYQWFRIFRLYPWPQKTPGKETILFPPSPLWKKGSWFSFWLRPKQLKKKRKALEAYRSQFPLPNIKSFFASFLTQNELFEKMS